MYIDLSYRMTVRFACLYVCVYMFVFCVCMCADLYVYFNCFNVQLAKMDVNCGKWREEVRKRLIFLGHLPGSAEQFRILTAQQLLGRGRSVSCLEEQASTDSSSGEKGVAQNC